MSIIDNINYMKRFAAFPCATPNPIIVIELAFQAFLPVLYEFVSYQVVQNTKLALKQMGSRNAPQWYPRPRYDPNQRRGGRGHGGGIFTPSPSKYIQGEKWGPNTLIFRMIDLEQRALYFYLIADLATLFMARWTSLMYMHEKCPFDHQCYKDGPVDSIYIGQGEVNALLPVLFLPGIRSGGLEVVLRMSETTGKLGTDVSFSVDTKLKRFLSDQPPSSAWVEIREVGTGATVASAGGPGQANDDGTSSSGTFHSMKRGAGEHSYHIVLVNNAENEDVRIDSGTLHLASGNCTTLAPLVPLDMNHLMPRFR